MTKTSIRPPFEHTAPLTYTLLQQLSITTPLHDSKRLFELISKFPGTIFGGALGQDYIVWHWTFLFSYDDDK